MTIEIIFSGNGATEQQIAAVIHSAAAALGLQDRIRLNGKGSGRCNDTRSPASKELLFPDFPDPDIARFRIAQAAGIRTMLFVCTGNAMRSQIAEALVNHLFRGKWAAFSAGVMPLDVPKEVGVVMREIGIDVQGQRPKHVDLFQGCTFDLIVILCSDADRICPTLPGCACQDHLIFDDPLAPMISEGAIFGLKSSLRRLRDEMRNRLTLYLKDL